MTAKDFIISKLQGIIKEETKKNAKSLLVFKGFPSYSYDELISVA